MQRKYSTLERLALGRRVSLALENRFWNQMNSKEFVAAHFTSSRLARVDDVVLRLEKAVRA
jgi:hypothetical protein